ncbi:DUF2125 domain-containing protein [Jannaschia sp. Os4]|uniref:DUF2125 domain-containing protein n=1 Tax=Jannaschia sp. Os4 TaxID=2807617 RepID=UPI0019393F00|nr:DUF2125 domain-containing protein [Jannaschia sp. Os4]MBM2575305.1 DUF2125 domain-containing protein [Jannaschia sp. Os4]
MTRSVSLTALCVAGLASPAWADLTPAELWADWQATARSYGATLEAGAVEDRGDALVLDGMTLAYATEVEGEAVAFDFTYEEVTLTARDAQTVVVTMPERTAFTASSTQFGETREDSGTLEQVGMETVVTDDGTTRTYASTGERFTQVTNSAPDEVAGLPALIQTVTMTDISSVTTFGAAGDPNAVASESAAAGLVVDVRDPEGSFSVAYQGGGLDLDGRGTLPEGTAEDAFAVMNALDMEVGYGLGPATFKIVSEVEGAAFTSSGSVGASRTDVAFGADGIAYSGTLDGMDLTVTPAPIPVPFQGSLDEMAFALTLPTRATPEAQGYGLRMTVAGLELSDAIWSMFDPSGQLPRDAATVRLDLGGDMRVTGDLFSEEAANAPVPPLEPQSLDIRALEVTAAGASLTGTGALTFPVLFPQPQPVGTINLRLTGGFDLLDSLVTMGLVPADQATFIRGMSGVVARPAEDGALVSEIEFTEGGGIVANGLPLQ